jgi:hypothetical protein
MSTDSNNVIAAKAGSQVLPAKERMESQMNADGPDSQLGINNREPSRTANPHAGIPSLRRIQPLVTSQFKSDTYAPDANNPFRDKELRRFAPKKYLTLSISLFSR